MGKVKMVLNRSIPMVLIAVALMIPATGEAGSVTIWPDQLIPTIPASSHQQSILNVSNGSFYAPITIPIGAQIVRINYYHSGEAGPASTRFTVGRMPLGNNAELIGGAESTDATGAIIRVAVPITGNPIIRSGYRYYVRVVSDYENSLFLGAKIVYRE